MQYVFLSHDVDWRKTGPSLEHIMARKDRFSTEIINELPQKNPYYNIPEYMEIEEKYDTRSTFFFRTFYEDGNFLDYEDEIKNLMNGGWEIGLHLDPSSINDLNKIMEEKTNLESITKSPVFGNRVHYLGYNDDLPLKLSKLGFFYDSTIRKSKNIIDENEMGFHKFNGIIEFPITIMDAYLFTYMHITEDKIISTFDKTLEISRNMNPEFNIITIIWHDNVLKMKGGRMYREILEFLRSQDDVEICRGIDLVAMVR